MLPFRQRSEASVPIKGIKARRQYKYQRTRLLAVFVIARIMYTNKLSRTSVTHLIAGQRELCEILFEARSEIGSLPIIRFFVSPGIPGNEHFIRDIRTRRR